MRYGVLTPDFPKKAFVASVTLCSHGKLHTITFSLIQTSLTIVANDIKEIADGIADKHNSDEIYIINTCTIVPITYVSRYSLRKEFWDNPTLHYSEDARQKLFEDVYENPQFYHLLVVPQIYVEKQDTWLLSAAIAFPLGSSEEVIDTFMTTSDTPVDERAKYAALYELGTPYRYNWKTGKTHKFHIFSRTKQTN